MHEINFGSGVAAVVSDATNGGITIRFNPQVASNFSQRTAAYKAFPAKTKPALEKVADYVRVEMIPRTFQKEGPGWRKLSKRTKRERAEQGYGASHPILKRTGELFKELTQKSHPKHIEIVKTGKYARVTIGGSSEKFMRNQGGNWLLHIPSRPMIPGTEHLPLPQRDRMMIKKILEDNIRKELAKNG